MAERYAISACDGDVGRADYQTRRIRGGLAVSLIRLARSVLLIPEGILSVLSEDDLKNTGVRV